MIDFEGFVTRAVEGATIIDFQKIKLPLIGGRLLRALQPNKSIGDTAGEDEKRLSNIAKALLKNSFGNLRVIPASDQ
jgi:hypothetical protein